MPNKIKILSEAIIPNFKKIIIFFICEEQFLAIGRGLCVIPWASFERNIVSGIDRKLMTSSFTYY